MTQRRPPAEQPDADVAAQLVVDVTADARAGGRRFCGSSRAISRRRSSNGASSSARGVPEQLVVALVAAEDRVGQVEEDDRRLGEVGEALVLEPAAGHQVAGRGRVGMSSSV